MNKVLVKIGADWCMPCKQMSDQLGNLNLDSYELQIFDVDHNPEVAKEFNVRSIPTLIILQDGEEIRRCTGKQSNQQLQDFLKD